MALGLASQPGRVFSDVCYEVQIAGRSAALVQCGQSVFESHRRLPDCNVDYALNKF